MKRAPARVTVLSVTAAMASVLVFCPPADAQITVPLTTLPAVGDTFRLAQDTDPRACVLALSTPPWNLSCLGADATYDVLYRPASEGSVTVPDATMFAVVPRDQLRLPGSSPTTEEYYNVVNGRLQQLASYGRHFNHTADSVFNYLPGLPERSAPLTSGSNYSQSLTGSLVVPASIVPGAPVGAESVRYSLTMFANYRVDSWGTLTIPGGSYDVLRETTRETQSTRIDYLGPSGTIGGVFFPSYWGTGDTIHHQSYYNDVSKEPIAFVEWRGQVRPTKVTFKRVLNDGDPCGDQSSSACNLPDTWLAGACVPNYVAAGSGCGDNADSACSNPDTCNGAGACVPNDEPNGTACSNGNACTTGETCQNATCTGGAPLNCNDNNACTNDSCSPATGCVYEPDPACAPQIALFKAIQQVESCAPANGVLDPSERVTYAVTLKNNSLLPTTNLVATLLASASVSSPSGAQSYGAIPAGGSATRSFTWTGIGACAAPWSAALALADGAQVIPAVTVSGTYGTPAGVCNTGCAVVRIATKAVLARNADGTVRATVTVSNTGSVQANNVMLTSALLGTSSGAPLSQALNSIPPGGSTVVTLTFPSSVLAGANVLKFGGTYTGGTFSSSLRVTVP